MNVVISSEILRKIPVCNLRTDFLYIQYIAVTFPQDIGERGDIFFKLSLILLVHVMVVFSLNSLSNSSFFKQILSRDNFFLDNNNFRKIGAWGRLCWHADPSRVFKFFERSRLKLSSYTIVNCKKLLRWA